MQSSNRTYLANLDHLRAFAAFEVFVFHIHPWTGCPDHCLGVNDTTLVPFFSLLVQGHSGVALFFCISGYIFTYLTDGKKINLPKFWLNRLLRLLPLFIFWGCLSVVIPHPDSEPQPFSAAPASSGIAAIVHTLTHPLGYWSIYIELQCYLLLPVILFCIRKAGGGPVLSVSLLALLACRLALWLHNGTVQNEAYHTLLGRGDQFLLGIGAFHLEKYAKRAWPTAEQSLQTIGLAGLWGIVMLYQYFNFRGGFSNDGGYPSPDFLWVPMPLLEGLCYAMIIVGYLQCRIPPLPNRILCSLGLWSYSIYLNHPYLTEILVNPVLLYAPTQHMMHELYPRLIFCALLVFPIIAACSALTYRLIEAPFLHLRLNYLQPLDAEAGSA